jgi:catalase-peroxidase
MFTTDIALKVDPVYRQIAMRFHEHPDEFELAFAKAWFKLTHRDMGPSSRYLGPDIPKYTFLWQDPLPAANHESLTAADVGQLKSKILTSGLTVPELVRAAWASAATFRGTDYRGGANGARIRLEPQRHWAVNDPDELKQVLKRLEVIQKEFNHVQTSGKQVSLADLIILGGTAAVEQAAKKAGYAIEVPFTPGRVDASQAQTDANSFAALEPTADGFRNFYGQHNRLSPVDALVDRANLMTLTVPEMTVLLGGMRVLNANAGQSTNGVLTQQPGVLSNDFYVNLLDMSTKWEKSSKSDGLYHGLDRATDKLKWTATSVDLIFGSNSELRAVAEVYASNDAKEKFVHDFVKAWVKVMNLDRFDQL